MKKLMFLLFLPLFALADVLPVVVDLTLPSTGPTPDGVKVYYNCADPNNLIELGDITGPGTYNFDVPPASSIEVCAQTYITDAGGTNRYSAIHMADNNPIDTTVFMVPDPLTSLSVTIDCNNLLPGWQCATP